MHSGACLGRQPPWGKASQCLARRARGTCGPDCSPPLMPDLPAGCGGPPPGGWQGREVQARTSFGREAFGFLRQQGRGRARIGTGRRAGRAAGSRRCREAPAARCRMPAAGGERGLRRPGMALQPLTARLPRAASRSRRRAGSSAGGRQGRAGNCAAGPLPPGRGHARTDPIPARCSASAAARREDRLPPEEGGARVRRQRAASAARPDGKALRWNSVRAPGPLQAMAAACRTPSLPCRKHRPALQALPR